MRALGLALLLGVVPLRPVAAEGLAHAHYVGLLTGVVDNGGLDEAAPTIGASYRYRVAERLAIGPMVDFVAYDDEDTLLVVAAAFWNPVGRWLVVAGPGVEFIDPEPSAAARSAGGGGGRRREFALRAGAGYEFHAGPLDITPAVGVDLVDGETTVLYVVGLTVGF
jgi:hypothetical protein